MITQKAIDETYDFEQKLENNETVYILDIVVAPHTFQKIFNKIMDNIDKNKNTSDMSYWLDVADWISDYANEHNWYVMALATKKEIKL